MVDKRVSFIFAPVVRIARDDEKYWKSHVSLVLPRRAPPLTPPPWHESQWCEKNHINEPAKKEEGETPTEKSEGI